MADSNLETLTPNQLETYLAQILAAKVEISLMMWGAPGIGKSSIVAAAASQNNLSFIDVRLSQLAPTDLRGLPVPENGEARWYPPEFLPRSGTGVLFLDELNMAPPAIQGIAQQLILDRRIGNYVVPKGWFIWAAGNRKGDKASVFDMPQPLANRFLHVEVVVNLEDWKQYAIKSNIPEAIIAFLSFKPTDLHRPIPDSPAWPSPRSWGMAATLLGQGLDIGPAVGLATESEFNAFLLVYDQLKDIDAILDGTAKPPFPGQKSPDLRWALTTALALRSDTAARGINAILYMLDMAPAEFQNLFVNMIMTAMRTKPAVWNDFARQSNKHPKVMKRMHDLIKISSMS